jgi:ferritin
MTEMADLFKAECQAAISYASAAADFLDAGYPGLAKRALNEGKEELDHAFRVAVQMASMMPEPDGSPEKVFRAIEQVEADVLGAYMEAEKSEDSVTRNFAQSIIPEQVAALGDARNDRIRAESSAIVMETSLD